MLSNWKLSEKSLTVIIVLLERKAQKTKRNYKFLIFGALTQWLSTMMRKDFRLFQFYLLDDLLESGNAELSFPKKFFVNLKTLYNPTLEFVSDDAFVSSSEADGRFSFLLSAHSQVLEVIFFGADGSSVHLGHHQQHIFGQMVQQILICDFITGGLEILKSECYIRILSSADRQPCDIEAFLPGINFL